MKISELTPENLMTGNEVRELLRISRDTLKRWRNDGTLSFYRIRKQLFYSKQEILNKLLENTHGN
jgi:excisionase family DNA binding protein